MIAVPTKRPRHTITEVGPVEEALDRVRAVHPDVDLRKLIVLGADELVRQTESEHRLKAYRAALRQRLVERTTAANGVDGGAAAYAREHGWARDLYE